MPNTDLVSIVINNYNYEAHLPACIDSALAQTYRPLEVIVVDDGSTDGSRRVIEGYGDRVRPVLRENGGQGAALNSGFAAARGEVIFFLDADDALLPDAAAEVMAAWRPDLAKVQFPLEWVDADGISMGGAWCSSPLRTSDVRPQLRRYGNYSAPPMSGNAFSRRCLEQILPVEEPPLRRGADGYVIALAGLYGPIAQIDRILGQYRIHGKNQSETGGTNLKLLRRRMVNNLETERGLKEHAARLGAPIEHSLTWSNPRFCRTRLLSLRVDPEGHPYPEDTVGKLLAAGVRASLNDDRMGRGKQILYAAWLVGLSLLPRQLLERRLGFFSNSIRHVPVPKQFRIPADLATQRRPASA